jgi:hypothetical protein
MSDRTVTRPLDKCPICRVAHEPRPDIPVDLTYCPKCGVPRFFPPGLASQNWPIVECVHCRHFYEPKGGGGSVVVFRLYAEVREFEPPRGLLQGLRLVRP